MQRGVVTVRRAERRDLEALGRLGAMLVRVHNAFDRKRFIAPMEDLEKGYAAFLGRVMVADDSAVFVAERDHFINRFAV